MLKNLKKTLHYFSACRLFQIKKQVHLQILKEPSTIFLRVPFSNIKKVYLKILEKNTTSFFACPLSQISKKVYL